MHEEFRLVHALAGLGRRDGLLAILVTNGYWSFVGGIRLLPPSNRQIYRLEKLTKGWYKQTPTRIRLAKRVLYKRNRISLSIWKDAQGEPTQDRNARGFNQETTSGIQEIIWILQKVWERREDEGVHNDSEHRAILQKVRIPNRWPNRCYGKRAVEEDIVHIENVE